MKILYIHQHFCTPQGSGGTRSYEFARRWVAQGHDVTMLCGTGYDETLPDNAEVDIEGIRVRTFAVPYRSTMSFVQRLRSFVDFAGRSSRVAASCRWADVVLATSTPLTVALPALAAKWFAKRPTVFEVRDVWPDAAVDAGMLSNPLLIGAARMLETLVYQQSDHIVALSTGMQDRIRRKSRYHGKISMIPNCSDLARFGPGVDGQAVRKEFGAEGKFVVLYVGAINLANDMEYLARATELTKDDAQMEWWFVGGGNRLDFLKQAVEKAGIGNVRFMGKQPKQRVPEFAAAADAGVVTFIPQPVYYENSPNKFFDYIAAGLPVVFSRDSWLAPYLATYENGWCCAPRQPEEMVARLRQLRDDPALAKTMGANSRRLAEDRFSRDQLAEDYLDILTRVASQ